MIFDRHISKITPTMMTYFIRMLYKDLYWKDLYTKSINVLHIFFFLISILYELCLTTFY